MNYCSKPLNNYRPPKEPELLPRVFTPSKVPHVQRWILTGSRQEEKLAVLRNILKRNEEREATKKVLSSSFHPDVVPKVHSWLSRAPEEERNAITRMFRSLASDPMMQPDAPAAWGEEERDGRVITMDTDGLGANRQGQVLKSTPRAPVNAEPISMDDHFVVDNAPPKPPKREMNGQSEPVEREVAQHVLPNHAHLKTPDNAERPQKVLAGHRKTKVGHWYQHGGAIPGLARKAGNDHVARDHAFPKIERPTSTQHNCKKVQWRQDEPRPATASGPYVAGMRTEFDIFPDWRAPHRQVVPMTQVPYRVRALRQTPATTKHACATFRRRDFVIHPEWITH